MAFGRMNPPTTGHLKLIDKVRSEAENQNAHHVVVLSHSQDSKKNPLSAQQKVRHLERYSPGTNFEPASKEHPTIIHHAQRLHQLGHDQLTVVAGSDRVKEYHDLLHKYNGKPDKNGNVPYNYKKIKVVSAGHRDPDAEGAEGMSGTKMREHAKNKNFNEFRKGVPSHVSDHHAKELMHDVRTGMGLHESTHGQFKAIFVTGGPGSGKDIIIREAIAEMNAVELNSVQAFDMLHDKHRLAQKSNDLKMEAIRTRKPLIINGPADDHSRFIGIKEELEELGYDTLMVFVDTTNEASQERNEKLTKMIAESVRQDKWRTAQANKECYVQNFENFLLFDNSATLDQIEESITDTYQIVSMFLEHKSYTETAVTWLRNHGKLSINESFNLLFEEKNAKENSKSIQSQTIRRYNPSFRAKGPADITPDNRAGGNPIGQGDSIKGDTFPRKNPNGRGHSGGAWSGAYSTEETNFNKDKETIKKKKPTEVPSPNQRLRNVTGLGQEFDTRQQGTVYPMSGLGDVTYRESISFNTFRKKVVKEAIDDPGATDMGVAGVLGGAGNKEQMDSYKDTNRNIGIQIKKKKKQEK
jgi:cytidyltransferase-like protein